MALSFIKSSGNIISEDFCRELAVETKADYVKDKSFGDQVKKIDEQIAIDFEHLRNRWEEIRIPLLNHEMDLPTLRDKWIKPLFKVLGFDLHINRGYIHNDANISYDIRHSGWNDPAAAIIHLVKTDTDLDSKDATNAKHPNKSPQDTLQSYLITTKHSWGILTNGLRIRVLRNFYHSITKGFLEFDVEAIFENASSEQFRVLYRICHRSRFEGQFKTDEPQIEFDEEGNEIETNIEKCLLEKFHEKSRETGIKVGNKLRDQVITTIETLGSGFTEHLDSSGWDDKQVKAYYAEILNLIYRFLFLLFAEQKGWLPVQNEVYARTYSLNALREFAERGDYSNDEDTDLWEGLKITFDLVARGYQFPNGDQINAFGGQLFSEKKIQTLAPLPLANKHLLKAMDSLCYFEEDKLRNRINYTTLAIDELGSVYESLLDFTPRIAREDLELVLGETKKKGKVEKKIRHINKGEFFLDTRGTDRKTTGSYYTDSRLVAQLIESALVPVIENAVNDKPTAKEKEAALLELKVADIACGSGAFLIAALEKMGEQLALIRKGDEEKPTDDQLREAKRDVLLNCIYGVDLNPMALELAKFSLWITASLPDMPLTFLDHKLKCGNSLIGATPELIEKGIPEDAYKAVGNDNPAICAKLKADAKRHLERLSKVNEPSPQYGLAFERSDIDELLRLRDVLNSRKQEEVTDVELAEEEFRQLEKMERKFKDWLMADVWTAAFFIEKTEIDLDLYATNITLENLRENQPVSEELVRNVIKVSDEYKFFHYHLEFPEVFEKEGFDCLLGNPPWETVEFKTQEFFKTSASEVAKITSTDKRQEEIEKLQTSNPDLYIEYVKESYKYESYKRFFKFSGSFPLTNDGKINLYSKFTEKILNSSKASGIIVQGDIATGFDTKTIFDHLIQNELLHKFHHFHNKGKFFDIHRDTKFALLTIMPNSKATEFMFNIISYDEIIDTGRKIELSKKDIALINPNTKNAPVLRNREDLVLLRKLYSLPIVCNLTKDNPWDILNHRMINGSDDSKYLKLLSDFDADIEIKSLDIFEKTEKYLPVYESKLMWHFDHRFATYQDVSEKNVKESKPRYVELHEKLNTSFEVQTKDYIQSDIFKKKYSDNYVQDWFIIYRNVTGASNSRTTAATIVPKVPVVLSAYILKFDVRHSYSDQVCFLANINSFVFDFISRKKIGGSHLSVYVFNQISIIPPTFYSNKIRNIISKYVLQLTYTSNSLSQFANNLGYDRDPFIWNEKERFQLQCELDAIYAHLYGLEKEEMDYILETFPIVKRKEIDKYGSYRTKETILQLYDEFAWVRVEMQQQPTIKTTE